MPLHPKATQVEGSDEGTPEPRLERFELLGEIARGGMGIVFRARDRVSGNVVALKSLDVAGRPRAALLLEAFEREFQVLKGLEHPRIIRVFDYGRTPRGAYYTMELLEGRDVGKVGPIPWREACQYLRDVATSLSLLHARRLVHRDLSPGNVKLTGDGHCKLIDFGALTDFGPTDMIIGTPPFIAPEVISDGRLDHRADLYALGALGYYCLTGRHAFDARSIEQLPAAWDRPPPRLAAVLSDLPAALDELLMSLLSEDPLARPASAAEVIMRLDGIAALPPDDEASQRLLAQSYLVAPRYVGRERELSHLEEALRACVAGQGRAVCVAAAAGSGRTRLLEEMAVRAALAGAVVARADASAQQGRHGTVRALTRSLLESQPDLARRAARGHESALSVLGGETAMLLEGGAHSLPPARSSAQSGVRCSLPPSAEPSQPESTEAGDPTGEEASALARGQGLEEWFLDVCLERPLVLLVDNVECVDDGSLGALLALSRAAPQRPLLVVLTEQSDSSQARGFGFATLRDATETMSLGNLSLAETTALLRSVFGDTPRIERLAEWAYDESAGRPLHCLGLIRRWVTEGLVRNERGAWVLPSSRPPVRLGEALEDALARHIDTLSIEALTLLRCLSLYRGELTLELCRLLTRDEGSRGAVALLDELAVQDMVRRAQDRYVFSSAALRQTVLKRMGAPGRRTSHLRLGNALAVLAETRQDLATAIDAGWHLIRGGDEARGAEMIADLTQDSVACNVLVANLHHMGEPVEAALRVYRNERRSLRERLPLLTALAQAGYYEHYRWAERYGDEALDAVEKYSGMGLARRLTPFTGRHLALGLAFAIAAITHYLLPRRVRGGSFIDLQVHLCCTVTSLCGVAAIGLNANRCERVAQTMAPVAVLPRRVALVGIYRFCQGLQQIARENQVEAFRRFDALADNFSDPKYFWFMPPDTHAVYTAGCHFARGAFAMMRADGRAALESAAVLEHVNLPLYTMIASQLRYLYHLNRGDLAQARIHREQVEVHAARVGSAWQVELWEPASLIPYYVVTNDVVELSRIAHRLGALAEDVPSMWRYRELAYMAAELHTRRPELYELALNQLTAEPRSYIGWSTTLAAVALYRNQFEDYEAARELCERALCTMSDDDRACVMIFLLVDLQAAVADAGLGHTEEALARLDNLLALHGASEHPLTLGLVHETRARIALAAGREDLYRESLQQAKRWLQSSGTPSLVAACDRLAHLGDARSSVHRALRVWELGATDAASEASTCIQKPLSTARDVPAEG